jgi:hypothetical protein
VKGRLVAAFLLAIVVLGAAAIVTEVHSLAQGDYLSLQERANVSVTRSVVLEMLDNEGMVWVERAVDDEAPIHTFAGTFTGPEGARMFATLLAGGEDNRGFEVDVVAVNGELVELDWRLAGPLTPGIVKSEYVPEGSYASGRVVATVMNGTIEEMTFLAE